MKLFYVNDFYEFGGAEVIMHKLSEAMNKGRHEVFMATTENIQRANHFNINQIKHEIPLLKSTVFFNVDPMVYQSFQRILKKVKPDLMHCHNLHSISLAPIKIALMWKFPCVVTIHDYWPVCLNRSLVKPDYTLCNIKDWDECVYKCRRRRRARFILDPFVRYGMKERRRILSKARITLVAVSNFVKKVLEHFGYPQGHVKVIYNGVDTNLFSSHLQHGYKKIVLFAGHPSKLKGIDDFILLAKNVRKRFPKAKFIVVGGKVEGAGSIIENPGKVSLRELIDYYQRATCVCLPSIWPEPLPTVALEAMACAKPVVAYAVGGLIEVVKDGKTGFLVQRGDIKELSDRVIRVLKDDNLARSFGLSARKRVEKLHSIKRMVRDYEDLYMKSIGGS